MIELKCVICGKTEPSTIQIKNWICSNCLEEERANEQKQIEERENETEPKWWE